MADEHRTLWHLVAVIATLALAVVVAVVAVTRDERGGEPAAEPTTTPTTSGASPSPSPAGLNGEGPYVLYLAGLDIVAFDVVTGSQTRLTTLGQHPAPLRSWQPGTGRIVAFVTGGGEVWSISRRGAKRIGVIPSNVGSVFLGGAVSADDRKLAVAAPDAKIVVIDLQSGRPTVIAPPKRGEYPRDRGLLPIGWGLGGTVLYGIPACEGCSPGAPGLYAYDTNSGASARIGGTASTVFYEGRTVLSMSGQALYYASGARRRCRSDESEPCEGPQFHLRRIVAGDAGSSIIRGAPDYPLFPDAISQDGGLLLVRRPISQKQGALLELYSAEGERQPALRGIPEGGGEGLAILPDDAYVLMTTGTDGTTILVLEDGRARTIAAAQATETLAYLGWLR